MKTHTQTYTIPVIQPAKKFGAEVTLSITAQAQTKAQAKESAERFSHSVFLGTPWKNVALETIAQKSI